MKNIAGKWNIGDLPGAVWEFIEFRRDERGSKGMLIEQCVGHSPNFTIYLFDFKENTLVVDRSDLCDDGYVFACYEERYRVEPVGGHTLKIVNTTEW